ncbi:MAG: hypothetical protein ACK5JF_10020 [Oscillospiraceae bacterium]
MEKLKRYVTTTGLSFTLVVLLQSTLALFGWSKPFEADDLLMVFAITAIISAILYFLEPLVGHNLLVMMVTHLLVLESTIILFVFFVFKMLEVNAQNILSLLITGVVVYLPITGFTLLRDKHDADKINKKILQKRDKKADE